MAINGEAIKPSEAASAQIVGWRQRAERIGHYFIEHLKFPKPSDKIERLYQEQRMRIKGLYRQVDQWHGTGRFGRAGQADMLRGIAQARQLTPSDDSWDVTKGEQSTISLTHIRPYAGGYADMHSVKGEELQYKDPRSNPKWFLLEIQKFTSLNPRASLSEVRHITSLLLKASKEGHKWIANKTGDESSEGKSIKTFVDFMERRSSVPGNYPILIGVKHGAFEPIKVALYGAVSEERSDKPIHIENLTHMEVPLAHLQETRQILDEYGINLPVIPRELGERYSSEFSDREIMAGEGFNEAEYPTPKEIPSISIFDKDVSQTPEPDHLMRTQILREVLTNLLKESGQMKTEESNPNSNAAFEQAILKDVEELDRKRLEGNLPLVITPNILRRRVGLNPGRLLLPLSKQLIPMANELYRISRFNQRVKGENPKEAVLDAGIQMGIISQ